MGFDKAKNFITGTGTKNRDRGEKEGKKRGIGGEEKEERRKERGVSGGP